MRDCSAGTGGKEEGKRTRRTGVQIDAFMLGGLLPCFRLLV